MYLCIQALFSQFKKQCDYGDSDSKSHTSKNFCEARIILIDMPQCSYIKAVKQLIISLQLVLKKKCRKLLLNFQVMMANKLLKFVLLFLFINQVFISCELLEEDDHCQFNGSKIETWSPGEYVITSAFMNYSDGEDGEGYVKTAILGGTEFLSLDNVCTSRGVTLSAEVEFHPEYLVSLGEPFGWHCELYYRNNYPGSTFYSGHLITLARTNLNENILRLNPYNVPILPNSSDVLAGGVNAFIMLTFYAIDCQYEDRNTVAAQISNYIIKSAKITAEYTQY